VAVVVQEVVLVAALLEWVVREVQAMRELRARRLEQTELLTQMLELLVVAVEAQVQWQITVVALLVVLEEQVER
jgi:hypothetical protein